MQRGLVDEFDNLRELLVNRLPHYRQSFAAIGVESRLQKIVVWNLHPIGLECGKGSLIQPDFEFIPVVHYLFP